MGGRIEVVAGIIWQSGEYLAVERPTGEFAGLWEFPGGKIEPGESPAQALVRELEEELSITPARFEFWRDKTHVYPQFEVHLHFFHIFDFTGALIAREGQTMAWLKPGDPGGLAFLPADVEIVQALKQYEGLRA